MSDYETERKALEDQMRVLTEKMAALKMSHEASKKEAEPEKEKLDLDDWEQMDVGDSFFITQEGEFYVGDLCYELDDEIYDRVWGGKFNYESGVYRRKSDGALFGMFSTDGDGEWRDVYTRKKYCVDAGHLGFASVSICKGEETKYYTTFRGATEFCTYESEDTGARMYQFGHILLGPLRWDEEDT